MGDETFESVVRKLADLDVQYLNLHRTWRKEKADSIRMENALKNIQVQNEELKDKLKAIEYEIDNSDMGTAVEHIIKIFKG